MSDVLAGGISLGALQSTHIENLRVLPCGERARNPAELLGSEWMTHLIEAMREEADMVVFDTPPCLPVTDAEVLASRPGRDGAGDRVGPHAEGSSKKTMEVLGQVRARVLGCILNKIDQSRKGLLPLQLLPRRLPLLRRPARRAGQPGVGGNRQLGNW